MQQYVDKDGCVIKFGGGERIDEDELEYQSECGSGAECTGVGDLIIAPLETMQMKLHAGRSLQEKEQIMILVILKIPTMFKKMFKLVTMEMGFHLFAIMDTIADYSYQSYNV
ncbi:MAG: hypothetical protein EZS28_010328 [Streblomastix strix]|uniref:Uncharacterized protein n=1 Tax=Streblomastix strix TaxID=222440 RepID=A0A5J4WGI8_9EUKA|nr:MAG: hypothetical protein EZS28_010328 [Streblomastix strix]